MPQREQHNGVLEQTSCEASMACPPECGMKTAKGARNPRSAVGRRRMPEGKTCVVRPGSAMPVTGSGTPREEGAIWRMTRCGRRSLSEGARVVRVARERDDICVNRRRPVCRLARCRNPGSVTPISPARRDRRRSGQSNRSSTRRHGRTSGPLGSRAARATDSIGTLRLQRVRHASFIARNPLQRKTARARTKPSGSAGRLEEKARGPTRRGMETPKRDRPEAGRPGQREREPASVAGDRKPQERRPTE